ncbi:MAG: enoyl-CoA hydratase/isomerase family protein [Acidobacteria bacterium]|nr:enoyl-CoA hydratase/isomerase family protein [Acidobacteriota bacterium]
MPYECLQVRRAGPIEYLTLNRPDVRNAFNDRVIEEFTDWAARTAADATLRIVVLQGAGRVFSAGGDLAWMARGAMLDGAGIRTEAGALHAMLLAIDRLPQAVIGRIHGAAIAGGVGLVAVCDVAIAAEDTQFGFSEVTLGIVPAIISPFVVAKIGTSAARELFLTAARFTALRARELGLVHRVVPSIGLDAAVDGCVAELLSAAPGAVIAAKELLRELSGHRPDTAIDLTAEVIAERRLSVEGRAGVQSFLSKTAPPWTI